jgi:hypothetical protein
LQLADTGLLNAQLAQLTAESAELARQRSNPLPQRLLLLTHRQELVDILLRQLAKLKTELTLLLRGRQSKLAQLTAQGADVLTGHRLLLGRGQAQLRGKVLQLARLTNARQTQLTTLQSAGLCQLLCGQAELTCLACGLQRRTGARLAELPRQRAQLLLAPLLLLESLLCALRGRFEARGPHLSRRATLLLQNVALQFLLGHRLTLSAESARPNRLGPNALLRYLALTTDVRQGLLDGRIFKLPHEGRDLGRIEPGAGACQSGNALLRRRAAHAGRAHQSLLRLGRRSARPRGCQIGTELRTAHLTANAARQALQRASAHAGSLLRRADAAKKLADALLTKARAHAQTLLQHLVCRRLGLEGQAALHCCELRGLVDKLLARARRAHGLLQRRRRLPGQKVLALPDHLRARA